MLLSTTRVVPFEKHTFENEFISVLNKYSSSSLEKKNYVVWFVNKHNSPWSWSVRGVAVCGHVCGQRDVCVCKSSNPGSLIVNDEIFQRFSRTHSSSRKQQLLLKTWLCMFSPRENSDLLAEPRTNSSSWFMPLAYSTVFHYSFLRRPYRPTVLAAKLNLLLFAFCIFNYKSTSLAQFLIYFGDIQYFLSLLIYSWMWYYSENCVSKKYQKVMCILFTTDQFSDRDSQQQEGTR